MRAFTVLCLGVVGCGTSASSGDAAEGDPQAMVKIDGEGTVAVRDQSGNALAGSPFSCGGGNCSNDIVTTAQSITFTPTPAATFTFARATIEIGGAGSTPVMPAQVISVDGSAGWVLQIAFENI